MRTLLVTKIISLLLVINSDELKFLTKALILNDLQPFFIFFFHLSFSLTLSLIAHSQHPNIQTIPTPNQITFTASKQRSRRLFILCHSQRSRRCDDPICDDLAVAMIVCRSPFATISPSQPSFADPHSQQSRRRNHRLPIPIHDDLVVATIVC